MDITIRPETLGDYGAIADVNYDAFVNWHPADFKAEPLLVDMLRHNALFDPDLSLVAEQGGRIVGHVLFSPYDFVVVGRRQRGLVLAPIAVAPDAQRLGIGKMLIAQGHKVAREKGYAFSLLCGHPEYYPRFGYAQRMFSLSGARVRLAASTAGVEGYTERPVLAGDIPWITERWAALHDGDDLALYPGGSISQWMSHSKGCRASVVTAGDEAVGYVRYHRAHPIAVKELLVREGRAHDVLSYLLRAHDAGGDGELTVALHPDALRGLLCGTPGVDVADAREAFEAFMLCVLDEENAVLARYRADVAAGRMKPGLLVLPPSFDIDE